MKSQSIIELIKTSNGFSIIENEILMNKPASIMLNSNCINQTNIIKSSKQKLAPTTIKKCIPQQNYTIYPYINNKQLDNHKYIIIPSKTQWFNLNFVHQIEKKELSQWFKLKKGVSASINLIKFQKNQELYRKYRNYIIQLGKTQYVTQLMARKGLAGDASSIIRIHNFLEKYGLINYVFQKPIKKQLHTITQDNHLQSNQIQKIQKRKDCFEKDKTLLTKSYDKDQLELIKKITKKFRPICSLCQGICGIVWYQYIAELQSKKFINNSQTYTKTVQSGDNFEYGLISCYSCFSENKFPFILRLEDFNRKTLTQFIQVLDLDKKYRRKNLQIIKIVEIIQNNKFNIKKSSQILNITQKQLFQTLMQIPIVSLEKISRVEPQTEDQNLDQSKKYIQKAQLKEFSKQQNQKSQKLIQQLNQNNQQVKIFKDNLQNLQFEEKKYYQEFLQSWLLKLYTKIQEIGNWEKSVKWRTSQNQSTQKYNLAQRLKKNVKI